MLPAAMCRGHRNRFLRACREGSDVGICPPPPWWGRVGERGERPAQCGFVPSLPNPPPPGGRGQEASRRGSLDKTSVRPRPWPGPFESRTIHGTLLSGLRRRVVL